MSASFFRGMGLLGLAAAIGGCAIRPLEAGLPCPCGPRFTCVNEACVPTSGLRDAQAADANLLDSAVALDAFDPSDAFSPDAATPIDVSFGPDSASIDASITVDAALGNEGGTPTRLQSFPGTTCATGRFSQNASTDTPAVAASLPSASQVRVTAIDFTLAGPSAALTQCNSSREVTVYVWAQSDAAPRNDAGVAGIVVPSDGDGMSNRPIHLPLPAPVTVEAGGSLIVVLEARPSEGICVVTCQSPSPPSLAYRSRGTPGAFAWTEVTAFHFGVTADAQ